MGYYPAFLDMGNRPCVVIGGGEVARGKIQGLLAAGAQVTVISPEVTSTIQTWADEGRLTIIPRPYQAGDLAGACLVIAATDDPATNVQVSEAASRQGLLVNVVDAPQHSSFVVPSLIRQGHLIIAISTGGTSPALAARLRQRLEPAFGPDYALFLELMGALREPLARHYPDQAERRRLYYRLVDSDVLDLLRAGDDEGARRRIEAIVGAEVLAAAGI